MTLAAVTNINIIPNSGILDLIFHQTWFAINILGWPGGGGYKLTLIGLIIILIIAIAAAAVTEKLTGSKPGKMIATVIITLFGSWLFQAYVLLPFDISLEGVRLIAAFLGAVVVAVFYVLIRNALKGGK